MKLKKLLEEHDIHLSEQQIRLRLEVLQELGLLNARQGRSGTTITNLGESYLQAEDLYQFIMKTPLPFRMAEVFFDDQSTGELLVKDNSTDRFSEPV